MTKRRAEGTVDWESQPCALCTVETLPQEDKIQWLACESCRQWFHTSCLNLDSNTISAYFCEACTRDGKGTTHLREERPKRAKLGIDYTALDSGQHVNSLRHAYTTLIEKRSFGNSLAKTLTGNALTRDYLHEHGFMEPIIVRQAEGLDMSLPHDLTVTKVAQLVGEETPIEVMDVPTQDEDKGWTLGKWATFYNEPNPTRVRNVISLEVTNTPLGDMIKRPSIVRHLDVVTRYWPQRLQNSGKTPKVQAYCLMSLQNSYTDFHVDFAGTSVYYHILQGSKTFLFIAPTPANLNKYSDWCKSSNQSTTFLADECKDTFKVELSKGDTMFIPSGWIHAVHTPEKSLVIGGNFLHLYGMQKHLEIADIEELTKVPGKFRFPYFNKTLWFTAIGILVQAEEPSRHQILGLWRLAEYLFTKASESRDKAGRKSPDDIPLDHMQCPPTLLVKVLFLHVQHYANKAQVTLPNMRLEHKMQLPDIAACPLVVKADVPRVLMQEYASDMAEGSAEDIAYDSWVEVSHDPTTALKPKSNGKASTSENTLDAKTSSDTTQTTTLDSPNIFAEQNSYLPPLKAFGPPPVLAPRIHPQFQPRVVTADGKNATTCFRCKTRKRKCDKLRPCDSCKEAGLADTCSDTGIRIGGSSPSMSPSQTATVQDMPARIDSAHSPNEAMLDVPGMAHSMSQQQSDGLAGSRCGRCAKDKRPCGREQPICDRCQKKGLQPADCIYKVTGRSRNRPNARGSAAANNVSETAAMDKTLTSTSASPEHTFLAEPQAVTSTAQKE